MIAKEKNWDQAKINKMLSDRGAFEKEFNTVSQYQFKAHLFISFIFI